VRVEFLNRSEGRPLCLLADRASHRQLEMLFYECIMDPFIRERPLAAGGLCHWHVQMAAETVRVALPRSQESCADTI
jgi:hypothetical protein